MGCSCQMLREEPVTRPGVAWTGPSLSAFFRWVRDPARATSLSKWPRAGFSLANHRRHSWNVRLYAGATFPMHRSPATTRLSARGLPSRRRPRAEVNRTARWPGYYSRCCVGATSGLWDEPFAKRLARWSA